MSNDYRNESRRRPPLEKYGTPGTQYPTPNPYDVVITEEVTSRAQVYEPVLYGTPHPTVPQALLCYQGPVKSNATDKAPVRIYANPRLAQDAYNLVNGDDEANDPLFPVFMRSYLLPRGYPKATHGSALTALIGLALTAGGTGYGMTLETPGYGKVALSFTGGEGSGAAGWAEVAAGAVVAVVLTQTGSGYTSAPTATVTGGGSGASIVALLQPPTALLTNEAEQPAEDPFGGFYVRVTRTWETLPGKVVEVSEKCDPESGSIVTVTRQKKMAGSVVAGFSIEGMSVVSKEKQDIDGLTAYEVTETISQSPYNDEVGAKAKEEMRPYGFPGYILSYGTYLGITFTGVDLFGPAVGVRNVQSENVPHTTKTWWVTSMAKPTLFFDEITMDNLAINNQSYKVLHDDITRGYGSFVVTIPATEPSFTEYYGNVGDLDDEDGHAVPPPNPFTPGAGPKWIGTSRVILGSVENDGHPYRWRLTAVSVVMR